MNIATYINYFRQLAILHKLLRHNPLTETNQGSADERRFGWYNANDVLTGLRFQANWPALLVELYEEDITAPNTYDINGIYTGAFSVFARANINEPATELTAYQTAETIMQQIIHRLYQDHFGTGKNRCQTPFQYLYLDKASLMPVGPVFDNCFGWRFEFRFKPTQAYNYNTPADDYYESPEEPS